MQNTIRNEHFNSHPHEEDDRDFTMVHAAELYFNSHPHEEDDNAAGALPYPLVFQLTSSRRG